MMIGKTISRYNILEKLGEGGMGVVYKAHDTKLERTVALKFLPQHLTKSEEDKQRFIREAKAAAALNHPHICMIHSVDEYDGNQFIVMEYVDGMTLRGFTEKGTLASSSPGEWELSQTTVQGEINVEQVLNLALQIAEALAEAHEKGIVHRDIKPENIMVDSKNRIKVMDFGLAKLKGSLNITKAGSTVGTIAYMSPEQIQGEDVDHRSDIFSFGVVLYEMLIGQTPFRGDHEAAMIYSIMNEDHIPPSKYIPDISPDLIHIVDRLLEKIPEDRYQSMNEVLTELRRWKKKSSRIMKSVSSYRPPEKAPAEEGSQDRTADVSPKEQKEKSSTTISFTIPTSGRGAVGLIGIFLFILAIGVGGYLYIRGDKSIPDLPDRVAVALFENRTGNPEFDYLSKTLTDFIIQGLVQIRMVDIVPTETVYSLADASPASAFSIQRISDHTNATMVVSGSYSIRGDELSLTARIINVLNNELIYSIGPVTGSKDNMGEIMEKLQSRVLGAISVYYDELFFNAYHLLYRIPPLYESYLVMKKGGEFFFRREYESAISNLLIAFQIDSTALVSIDLAAIAYLNTGNYTRAESLLTIIDQHDIYHTSLGRTHTRWIRAMLKGDHHSSYRGSRELAAQIPFYNYNLGLHALMINRPDEAIEALLKVDPSNPGIGEWFFYWDLLTEAYHLTGDHHTELKAARRGLAERPEYLSLVFYEMRALAALGRIDEINTRTEEIFALPSLMGWSPAGVFVGTANELRTHNHIEASRLLLDRAMHWYRTRPSEQAQELRAGYAFALYSARQWKEAQTIYEELLNESPDNITYHGYLGVLHAQQGNTQEAMRQSDWLSRVDDKYRYGVHTLWRARIAAVLGEYENGISLLRDAFAQGLSYGLWIHTDPAFEGIRDIGPFQQLLKPREEIL